MAQWLPSRHLDFRAILLGNRLQDGLQVNIKTRPDQLQQPLRLVGSSDSGCTSKILVWRALGPNCIALRCFLTQPCPNALPPIDMQGMADSRKSILSFSQVSVKLFLFAIQLHLIHQIQGYARKQMMMMLTTKNMMMMA